MMFPLTFACAAALAFAGGALAAEAVPVQVVYPHTRRLSTTVRAFVDECVRKLRQVRLD